MDAARSLSAWLATVPESVNSLWMVAAVMRSFLSGAESSSAFTTSISIWLSVRWPDAGAALGWAAAELFAAESFAPELFAAEPLDWPATLTGTAELFWANPEPQKASRPVQSASREIAFPIQGPLIFLSPLPDLPRLQRLRKPLKPSRLNSADRGYEAGPPRLSFIRTRKR